MAGALGQDLDVSTHSDLTSFADSNYYLESVKDQVPSCLDFFPICISMHCHWSVDSAQAAWHQTLLLNGFSQQHKCCAACTLTTSSPWSTHVIGQISLSSNQFIFPVWHDSGATAIPWRDMERCPEAANWMVANILLLLFSH